MIQDEQAKHPITIDALVPREMAGVAEETGVRKAVMGLRNTFALSILAGAFIAMGAVYATTVTAGAGGHLPFGVARFLAGLVFSLGLILVVVAGAELFTGNNLIVMAWANRRITTWQVSRNWTIVYIGNLVGSIATALLMLFSEQYEFGRGLVGIQVLNIALAKCQLGFVQAIALGIGCNALVCLAVWLCYSARSTTDRILAIIFPISAFVADGFEHCVANMYFIPIGLFVKEWAPASFWATIGKTPADFSDLTWHNFLVWNLIPVTIGNIIGGAVLVALIYWFIYIRKPRIPIFPQQSG